MKTVYILILSAIAVHGYRLSFLNKKYFTFSYGIQNSSSVVTELSTDRNLIVTTVGYFEPEACAGSTVQPNVTTNWLRRSGAGFASNLSWLYQKGYNGTVNGLNTTLQAANRVVNGLSVRDWLESIKARYYENLVFNMTDPINENEALSEDGRKETIKMRLQTMYSTMIECAHPCGQNFSSNLQHTSFTNGCGPAYFAQSALRLVPFGSFFQTCCDVHDGQYSLCGFDKRLADEQMLNCMVDVVYSRRDLDYSITNSLRTSVGYIMYGMVEMFGCKAWESAQNSSCVCSSNAYQLN